MTLNYLAGNNGDQHLDVEDSFIEQVVEKANIELNDMGFGSNSEFRDYYVKIIKENDLYIDSFVKFCNTGSSKRKRETAITNQNKLKEGFQNHLTCSIKKSQQRFNNSIN
ncbi:hypothetical protein ACTFIW_008725 [Dictyostelium discoideum]